MLKKCNINLTVFCIWVSDIKQSGGDMGWTFCANTVNFWDCYNTIWKSLFQQFCFKMQNWISKQNKKTKSKTNKNKQYKKKVFQNFVSVGKRQTSFLGLIRHNIVHLGNCFGLLMNTISQKVWEGCLSCDLVLHWWKLAFNRFEKGDFPVTRFSTD